MEMYTNWRAKTLCRGTAYAKKQKIINKSKLFHNLTNSVMSCSSSCTVMLGSVSLSFTVSLHFLAFICDSLVDTFTTLYFQKKKDNKLSLRKHACI